MVHYHEGGEGEPLLLLNGMAVSGRAWPPSFLHRLERSFRVIRMDNRGTGSSRLAGAFTMGDLADDAAEVLGKCGLEGAYVFGHSMGAMVAVALAALHPQCVRGLVVVSASPGGAMAVAPLPGILAQLMALRRGEGGPEDMARLNAAPGFADQQPEAFAAVVGLRSDEQIDEAVIGLQIAAMAQFDPAWLAAVAAPTLVVHGDSDRLVPPENGRRVAEQIDGARLVELGGVGHLVAAEATQRLVELIEEFLRADDAQPPDRR